MTDLIAASLTDDQLRERLADAVFCLALTQTMDRRAHWMAQIDALKQEQQRRAAQ